MANNCKNYTDVCLNQSCKLIKKLYDSEKITKNDESIKNKPNFAICKMDRPNKNML